MSIFLVLFVLVGPGQLQMIVKPEPSAAMCLKDKAEMSSWLKANLQYPWHLDCATGDFNGKLASY